MTSQHFVLSLKDEQGGLHFPLMRPRCSHNIWKARAPRIRALPILMTGAGVILCALSLTPILPTTPGISCPGAMVSDLIGCHIDYDGRAHSARRDRAARRVTYRRFGRLARPVWFPPQPAEFGVLLTLAPPGVDPEGSAAVTRSLPVDGLMETLQKDYELSIGGV